jgi:hypothetical protein
LVYFHDDRGGLFIRKITDSMAIMIRDVELMAGCFWFKFYIDALSDLIMTIRFRFRFRGYFKFNKHISG